MSRLMSLIYNDSAVNLVEIKIIGRDNGGVKNHKSKPRALFVGVVATT